MCLLLPAFLLCLPFRCTIELSPPQQQMTFVPWNANDFHCLWNSNFWFNHYWLGHPIQLHLIGFCSLTNCSKSSHEDMCLLMLERDVGRKGDRVREREREKHPCEKHWSAASHMCPNQGLNLQPMCELWLEWNPQLFGVQMVLWPTEPPGQAAHWWTDCKITLSIYATHCSKRFF